MENLKSYLDGELDLAQKTEVETHLRNDAELQKTVEGFSAISATLKTADSGEPYGLDKLEQRLGQSQNASIYDKKKIWRKAINWSAGSAGLLILAMLMFPVFAQSKEAAKKTSLLAMNKRGEESVTASTAAGISQDKAISEAPPELREQVRASRPQDGTEIYKSGAGRKGAGGGVPGDEATTGYAQVDGAPQSPVNGVVPTVPPDATKSDANSNGAILLNGHDSTASDAKVAGNPPRTEHRFTRDVGPTADGKAVVVQQAETPFKQEMRAKRDRVTQSIPGVPETDHGIFLERSGEMQVKVEDLKRAVNETTGMVANLDGFVTSSTTQNETDGGVALMTLRVPTKNFAAAVDKLEAMGELISENTGSKDITTETVDNSARMISWADEEDRLVKELEKTKNTNERYRLKQLIGQARANLESHKATVNSLLERAKYSTIQLTLLRGDKAAKVGGGNSGWSGDALRGAKDNLSSIGQVLGTFGIYILVFSPIWIPFAIAAYVIRKKTK